MQKLPHHARFVVVLLACLSVGLHWSALQVVGWVGMAVKFSHTRTVTAALVMTFDGQHPCDLCKLVQSQGPVSDGEKQSPPESKPEVKLMAATIWENPLGWLSRLFLIHSYPDESRLAWLTRARPPVPPPRTLGSSLNFLMASTAGSRCRVEMSRPILF